MFQMALASTSLNMAMDELFKGKRSVCLDTKSWIESVSASLNAAARAVICLPMSFALSNA